VEGAQIYAQVTYPAGARERSYGYVVVPDANGSVQLAVPPPGTGANVALVAVAAGHQPILVGSVEADTFWDDVEAHQGQAFLSFSATMQPGEFEIPTGDGSPPGAAPGAVASSIDTGTGSTASGGGGPGVGSIAVVAIGLAGAGLAGRRLARPRPAR
jgi:hypothetical protein